MITSKQQCEIGMVGLGIMSIDGKGIFHTEWEKP
jgi:hypothetical protein